MIQESRTTFAQRLKQARLARRLTPRELSRMTGLYVTAVRDIEEGIVKKVSTEVAGLLAEALGISKLWLCWGEGARELTKSPEKRLPQVKNVDETQAGS